MPTCPNCGHIMTSGEECRLYQSMGHCFGCFPGGPNALLDYLTEEDEGEEEDWSYGAPTKPTHGLPSTG